jgi:hypothetical protein
MADPFEINKKCSVCDKEIKNAVVLNLIKPIRITTLTGTVDLDDGFHQFCNICCPEDLRQYLGLKEPDNRHNPEDSRE